MQPVRRLLALALVLIAPLVARGQSPSMPERSRENLMVVVRESIGANHPDDTFRPTGKLRAKLANGQEIELEMASWEYIGDTHVRFVFDGPRTMINATPQDLEQLGIKSLDEALSLALANIRRAYGEPKAVPWESGLMAVEGKSPDLNSSYFLDRAFWQELLKSHPEGVIVSVAKRGGLLYVPASNTKAVESLKRGVSALYSSSGRLRISSALFLFKDDKWTVYQSPIKQ